MIPKMKLPYESTFKTLIENAIGIDKKKKRTFESGGHMTPPCPVYGQGDYSIMNIKNNIVAMSR